MGQQSRYSPWKKESVQQCSLYWYIRMLLTLRVQRRNAILDGGKTEQTRGLYGSEF